MEHIVNCDSRMGIFVKNWNDHYRQHIDACNGNVAVFKKWFKTIETYWQIMEPDIAKTIDDRHEFAKLK